MKTAAAITSLMFASLMNPLRIQRGQQKAHKKYLTSYQKPEAIKRSTELGALHPPISSNDWCKSFSMNYSIEELAQYIDWTPFFSSWQLAGKFPAILEDHHCGAGSSTIIQ
jgi:5-methyltetrahydrofolate--homocysteine methyltransferase